MNKTVVGVAVNWLYKQLTKNKTNFGKENSDAKANSGVMSDIIGAKLAEKWAKPVLSFFGKWMLPALAPALAGYAIHKYFTTENAHASGGALGGSENGLNYDIKHAKDAPPVVDFTKYNQNKLYEKIMEDKKYYN